MPELDLSPTHLEIVVDLLARHAPDAEVWAYGSRVNGTAHAGSDLDLVLREPEPPTAARRSAVELRDALEESDLPFVVEVLDWARLPVAFRREIERTHVVLQRSAQPVRP